MFLCDKEIIKMCHSNPPLISPFKQQLVRQIEQQKVISFGLGSFGYDLRLGETFYLLESLSGKHGVIDPKGFDKELLRELEVKEDGETGTKFIIMPPNSFGLGVTKEKLQLPRDITGFIFDKSTYARCGISALNTVIEAGWEGHITIELKNMTNYPVVLYVDEGVVQICFAQGIPALMTYGDRNGKYQGQGNKPVAALA